MTTNSYLILFGLTLGIFVLWVLIMTYLLLLKNVIPIYKSPEVTETKKDTIIAKRTPICKTDQELWEAEKNGSKPRNSIKYH
jgi:hypothetical protein